MPCMQECTACCAMTVQPALQQQRLTSGQEILAGLKGLPAGSEQEEVAQQGDAQHDLHRRARTGWRAKPSVLQPDADSDIIQARGPTSMATAVFKVSKACVWHTSLTHARHASAVRGPMPH